MLQYSSFATDCEGKFESLSDGELHGFVRKAVSKHFSDDPRDLVKSDGMREEMDTLGNLIDKLSIITVRMWHAQDELYRFRRMSELEWSAEFYKDPSEVRHILVRACDLNLQRNQLMDEVDQLFKQAFEMNEEDRQKLIARKHKQY